MAFFSPLRYPGGKGRLGAWMAEFVHHNYLSGGCYIEPYAGGSGVALHLLLKGYMDRIVINDIDPSIYAFWWALLNETDDMLRRVAETPITLEERKQQEIIYRSSDQYTLAEVGFATLFLNRTSRSGILTGGVIGGKNQTGKWKLDARFNRQELSRRIRLIAHHRSQIDVFCKDALELINHLHSGLPRQSLIYLDPPYYHKGGELYRNAYELNDHIAVAQTVQALDIPWVVTYDNCSEIDQLYQWANGGQFDIYYSASNKRRSASELVFYGSAEIPCLPYSRR